MKRVIRILEKRTISINCGKQGIAGQALNDDGAKKIFHHILPQLIEMILKNTLNENLVLTLVWLSLQTHGQQQTHRQVVVY